MPTWTCRACTWRNDETWTTCANCDLTRDASAEEAAAKRQAITSGQFATHAASFQSRATVNPSSIAAAIPFIASIYWLWKWYVEYNWDGVGNPGFILLAIWFLLLAALIIATARRL